MRLHVFGQSEHLTSEEARYATLWLGRRLMGPRLCRIIWIRLQLVPAEIVTTYDEKGRRSVDLANMMAFRGDAKYPRKFRINVNVEDQKRRGQLKALAHEMVHVKQYAKGEVYDLRRQKRVTRWKKELVDCTEAGGYHDWPWEEEAFRLEGDLYREYAAHVKGARFS